MQRVRLLVVAGAVALATMPVAAQEPSSVQPIHDSPIYNMIKTEVDYAPKHVGSLNWDVDGWIGGDFERVWLRSAGEVTGGDLKEAEAQLYYGWNVATFWDALLGLRQDFGPKAETYLAASVVGLAPYFFETEASLFVSTAGDVSARLKQSFELLITQKPIAEPHLEADLFAQDVPELGIGAGVADVKVGVQVRYEIVRKFAPYVDLIWSRKLGETSSIARAAGEDPEDTSVRLGLRFWF
jgi:copper resistance protein B